MNETRICRSCGERAAALKRTECERCRKLRYRHPCGGGCGKLIDRRASLCAACLGKLQRGPNNPNWRGGVSTNRTRYKRIQKMRYPERIRARERAAYLARTGALPARPCAICGVPETERHHPDYSRPDTVIHLCRKHHREAHRGMKWTKGRKLQFLVEADIVRPCNQSSRKSAAERKGQ